MTDTGLRRAAEEITRGLFAVAKALGGIETAIRESNR